MPLTKWMLVYVNKNEAVVKMFFNSLQVEGKKLGINVTVPGKKIGIKGTFRMVYIFLFESVLSYFIFFHFFFVGSSYFLKRKEEKSLFFISLIFLPFSFSFFLFLFLFHSFCAPISHSAYFFNKVFLQKNFQVIKIFMKSMMQPEHLVQDYSLHSTKLFNNMFYCNL